jgi:hypothetical protein
MRDVLLLSYCLLFLIPFSLYSEEKIIIDNLTLQIQPLDPPKNLSTGFIPDESRLLFSTDLKKFGFESIETSTLFETSLTPNEMITYYDVLFKGMDCRILQKETKNNQNLFLAESPGKRNIFTILISPKGNGSLVKLYNKKQTNY